MGCGDAGLGGQGRQVAGRLGGDRDQGPGGRLADQGGQRQLGGGRVVSRGVDLRQVQGCADPGGQGGLDQGDGQAAVGEVVGGGEQAAAGQAGQQAVEAGLGGQVEGGGAALEAGGGEALPGRAAELDPGLAQEPDVEAGPGEAGGDGGGGVASRPRTPTIGVGWMGRPDDSL